MKDKFKKIFEEILSNIFCLMASLTLKKKSNILISTVAAKSLNGNSMYFMNYLETLENLDFSYSIMTKRKDTYQLLRAKYGERAVYAYSLKAVLTFVRSYAIILTHGASDTYPFRKYSKNQLVMNLWHGTPIKRIGHLSSKSLIDKRFEGQVWNKFDYISVCSNFESNIMQPSFNIPKDKIAILGSPRNDIFYNQEVKVETENKILYLPTFRDLEPTKLFNFPDFDAKQLQQFLEENNVFITVKMHRNDMENKNNKRIVDSLKNVHLELSQNFDLQYSLLSSFALITDYSSVYLDYLLLNKPIIFLPYDLEEYEKLRGFNFDYNENTPGFKAITQKEFIEAIYKYIKNPDLHNDERQKSCNKFHENNDGESAKKTLRFITDKFNVKR